MQPEAKKKIGESEIVKRDGGVLVGAFGGSSQSIPVHPTPVFRFFPTADSTSMISVFPIGDDDERTRRRGHALERAGVAKACAKNPTGTRVQAQVPGEAFVQGRDYFAG